MEQKLTKTNLTAKEYNEAWGKWDTCYKGCMSTFGNKVVDRLPENEKQNLEAVQTPSANAVREKSLACFQNKKNQNKKKLKKGK